MLETQEAVQDRVLFNRENRGKLSREQKNKDRSLVKVEEIKASRDEFKDVLNDSKATFQESKKEGDKTMKKEMRNS